MLGNESGNGLDLEPEPEPEPGKETEKPHSVLSQSNHVHQRRSEGLVWPVAEIAMRIQFRAKFQVSLPTFT